MQLPVRYDLLEVIGEYFATDVDPPNSRLDLHVVDIGDNVGETVANVHYYAALGGGIFVSVVVAS